MKNQQKEPWQIAAARYCVENSETGFNVDDLRAHIRLNYSVTDAHISQFFEEEIQSPSGRQFGRTIRATWIPPLNIVSTITDYDELKEARESSRSAMRVAIGSLFIATVVGLVQIFVQICLK